MDIIFKFGEHFYTNEGSSIWIDFLLTFTGAFLGFLFALFISNSGARKLKTNRLFYLTTLLEKVVKSSKAQIENLNNFVTKVRQSPQNHHKISWHVSHDVKRYLKFDSQELFDAYIQSKHNDQEKIKSFNEINAYIDFIDQLFDQVKEISSTYTQSIYRRQLQIKEKIERVSDEIAIVAERIKIDDPANYRNNAVYVHLNNALTKFHQLLDNYASIDRLLFEFLDPMRYEIFNHNYHHHYNLDSTLLECKSAFVIYNDLKIDSDQAAIEISEITKKLTETIEKLTKKI